MKKIKQLFCKHEYDEGRIAGYGSGFMLKVYSCKKCKKTKAEVI